MPNSMQILELADDKSRKTNTVVYRSGDICESSKLLVFFPGDLADFAFSHLNDPLVAGDDLVREYQYSIDSLSWMISASTPNEYAVCVLKPNRTNGHYSIFSNFLPCDHLGIPEWNLAGDSVVSRPTSESLVSLIEHIFPHSAEGPSLVLVGFSKGCTLLSSVLRERDSRLLSRVSEFIMIDPGLSRPNTLFPFSLDEYSMFPCVHISIYLSPYQAGDPQKVWLKREIQDFAHNSGASLRYVLTSAPVSLKTHFESVHISLSEYFKR